MATFPVSIEDIEARWRPLSSEERTLASALMSDAWEVILLRRDPTIETRLEAGTLSPGVVRYVVSAMVLRVLKNPEGKRQESLDDYSYTRDASLSSGSLHVSPDELALLAPESTTGRSRRSVRLVAYGEL